MNIVRALNNATNAKKRDMERVSVPWVEKLWRLVTKGVVK